MFKKCVDLSARKIEHLETFALSCKGSCGLSSTVPHAYITFSHLQCFPSLNEFHKKKVKVVPTHFNPWCVLWKVIFVSHFSVILKGYILFCNLVPIQKKSIL